MLKPTRLLAIAVVSLAMLAPLPAAANPIISVGTSIPISSNTFVVPIEITGAVSLVTWQFDLSFNPSDVQINTGCDPFSGDPYCDLFSGPVTEGPFTFSDFVLLNPGIIPIDALSKQTGQLLAVEGAYQGFPPGPSGDGTLAYVEFLTIPDGTGEPNISVTSQLVTSTVPEPATLVLLAGGLAALLGVRRRTRHVENQGL